MMAINTENIEVKGEDSPKNSDSPPVNDIEEIIPDYSKAIPLDKKK